MAIDEMAANSPQLKLFLENESSLREIMGDGGWRLLIEGQYKFNVDAMI